MNRSYNYLTIEERAVIVTELKSQSSIRKIANILGRSPSTISSEIKQSPDQPNYNVQAANQAASTRKKRSARRKKLIPETVLWEVVMTLIMAGWSPEQIAGRLRRMSPDNPSKQGSH